MSPRFGSILVNTDIGASRTLRRLTVPERWTFVAGVLALAAKSPIRGSLLVAFGEPLSLDDIAEQAGVTRTVVKSTLDKLTRLDVLEHDDELGGLIVVNWNDYQREPKASDSREAWRERKAKQRESRPDVTRDSHAGQSRGTVTPMSRGDVTPMSRDMSRGEGKRREGKG